MGPNLWPIKFIQIHAGQNVNNQLKDLSFLTRKDVASVETYVPSVLHQKDEISVV